MKKLDEINKLVAAAKIAELPDRYFEKLKSEATLNQNDLSFQTFSEYPVFAVAVSLNCYTGCSRVSTSHQSFGIPGGIGDTLAREALLHYLNKNMREVLAGMGEYLSAKAIPLIAEAQQELSASQAILDALKQTQQEK